MNLKKIREYSRGNSGPCKRPRTPEHDSTGLNHARRRSSCLSMTSSENRFLLFRIMPNRFRRHRRRHLRHCRLRPSRPNCRRHGSRRNRRMRHCRMESGGYRTSQKYFRYCHPTPSCDRPGWRWRPCIRDTSRQTSDAPPIAMMITVSALFMASRRSDGEGWCAAKSPVLTAICRQIWRPRSLIVQVKYGTFPATDRYIRCPA